jgi:gamma-glutamylcyclotransferase
MLRVLFTILLSVTRYCVEALHVGEACSSDFTVRYFAFGSNLAKSVREGRRGLRPVAAAPGFVRDWRLAFNVPGLIPLEPAFASMVPAKGEECHGAIFTLTAQDWGRLCLSEGVPTAYAVCEVPVNLYDGSAVQAWTLSPGLLRSPVDLPPSERYVSLLRTGAQEQGLTSAWQERLSQVPTAWLGSPATHGVRDFERRSDSTFV